MVAGHEDRAKVESSIDWEALAKDDALVFLMGVKNMEAIGGRLIEPGRDPATPVALVRWGCTRGNKQQARWLTSPTWPKKQVKTPVVTVVGEVVELRVRWAGSRSSRFWRNCLSHERGRRPASLSLNSKRRAPQ